MFVTFNAFQKKYMLQLKGRMAHRTALGADPRGNLIRIVNALSQMPQRLESVKVQLDNLFRLPAEMGCEVSRRGQAIRLNSFQISRIVRLVLSWFPVYGAREFPAFFALKRLNHQSARSFTSSIFYRADLRKGITPIMSTSRYDYTAFLVRYKCYPCITNQIKL